MMDRALIDYQLPTKQAPTTRLWALCEEIAKITGGKPNRWLKAGEWVLQRALIDFQEATQRDVNGWQPIKNKAAYMTWLVKKYTSGGKERCGS